MFDILVLETLRRDIASNALRFSINRRIFINCDKLQNSIFS